MEKRITATAERMRHIEQTILNKSTARGEEVSATKKALASIASRLAIVEAARSASAVDSAGQETANATEHMDRKKNSLDGEWVQDTFVFGNWLEESTAEERTCKVKEWLNSRTSAHLESWAPSRSTIVKVVRKTPFVVPTSIEMVRVTKFRTSLDRSGEAAVAGLPEAQVASASRGHHGHASEREPCAPRRAGR